MKERSLGLGMTAKRTQRRDFLDEMEKVVPWAELVALAVVQRTEIHLYSALSP